MPIEVKKTEFEHFKNYFENIKNYSESHYKKKIKKIFITPAKMREKVIAGIHQNEMYLIINKMFWLGVIDEVLKDSVLSKEVKEITIVEDQIHLTEILIETLLVYSGE